jgi:hypothetical protein
MKPLQIDRRTLLRGVGSVSVALPFLEVMSDGSPAKAQALLPLRFLMTFAGLAGATDQTGSQHIIPRQYGADYLSLDSLLWTPDSASSPRTHALKPLADRNLGSDVTLISNLHLPRGSGAANWYSRWHPPTMRPLLSGMSSTAEAYELTSPTADVKAARVLGQDSLFPHLALRAQPEKYRYSEPEAALAAAGGRLSSDENGGIEPYVSPSQVYDLLFGSPIEAGGDAELRLAQDKAVVDSILLRAGTLQQRLGQSDQQRLELHLHELREVEKRLKSLQENPRGSCEAPLRPADDFGADDQFATERSGWSNETLRAQIMNDLIHTAFACDLNRAASLMYTYASSYSALTPILGREVAGDIHEVSHSAGDAGQGTDIAAVWAWAVGFYAALVDKFRTTPEGDGTMLDNLVCLFSTEAGSGAEEEAGELNDNFGAHSGRNMMVLVAGKAGGSLAPKGHLNGSLNGASQHPTQVFVSAMHAVGVNEGLGEITTGFPGLI